MPAANPTKRTYDDLHLALMISSTSACSAASCRAASSPCSARTSPTAISPGSRFGTLDGEEITDEIALNPSHFRARTTEQNLSTLVHEMVHLWQHHFGKPSRTGYHNKEWAAMMKAVGLIPSDTGAPGGKETGQHVSHYIEADGAFDRACAELVELGFIMPYVELWTEGEEKTRKKKVGQQDKVHLFFV